MTKQYTKSNLEEVYDDFLRVAQLICSEFGDAKTADIIALSSTLMAGLIGSKIKSMQDTEVLISTDNPPRWDEQ